MRNPSAAFQLQRESVGFAIALCDLLFEIRANAQPTLQRALPRGAQAVEQFGGRPGIGGQAELDLHLAQSRPGLEAPRAAGAPETVAGARPNLLPLAGML